MRGGRDPRVFLLATDRAGGVGRSSAFVGRVLDETGKGERGRPRSERPRASAPGGEPLPAPAVGHMVFSSATPRSIAVFTLLNRLFAIPM